MNQSTEAASFSLKRVHWTTMYDHLRSVLPAEGCGLLAGVAERSTAVYPVDNLLNSPTRFRMDPQQQAQAFIDLEGLGWDVLAIYHSHPEGPPHPSATDVAEFFYPDSYVLIWSPGPHGWDCRAYTIHDGVIHRAEYRIEE